MNENSDDKFVKILPWLVIALMILIAYIILDLVIGFTINGGWKILLVIGAVILIGYTIGHAKGDW